MFVGKQNLSHMSGSSARAYVIIKNDMRAPKRWRQNISTSPWWLAAPLLMNPSPSILADGTWAKPNKCFKDGFSHFQESRAVKILTLRMIISQLTSLLTHYVAVSMLSFSPSVGERKVNISTSWCNTLAHLCGAAPTVTCRDSLSVGMKRLVSTSEVAPLGLIPFGKELHRLAERWGS